MQIHTDAHRHTHAYKHKYKAHIHTESKLLEAREKKKVIRIYPLLPTHLFFPSGKGRGSRGANDKLV